MIVSAMLCVDVYAIGVVWAVLADYASASMGNVRYDVLHAWLVLVGPIVSLVIVPAAYAAGNTLHWSRFRLSNRWRTYGFPGVVTAIYLILNVISFVIDEIGG
jgi:hypothetical protein